MKKVYLAGPDVFRTNAKEEGEKLKAMLAEQGMIGLYPLDNELKPSGDPAADAKWIFEADCAQIRECDGVLANLSAFRGPSIDVGTAFEIGYAKALGKPVVGYWADSAPYNRRAEYSGMVDSEYPNLEDFGLFDNLMIACGVDHLFYVQQATRAVAMAKLKELMGD